MLSKKLLREFYLKTLKGFRENKLTTFPFYIFFFFFLFFFFSLFLILPLTPFEKKPSIYREGLWEEVKILTPYFTTNDSERSISNLIFPSLFEIYNGKLISKYLKKYLLNQEKNELQIELDDNLFFANGEKITTEDIRFSLEFAKKYSPSELNRFLNNLEFKVLNEKQGIFYLNKPDNYFLYRLVYLKIFPVKIFSSYSPDFINLEIARFGSGAFVFKEIKNEGRKILILEKNKYFKEKVYLKEIHFYFLKDQREALDAFFKKEIDGLAGINYFHLPPGFKKRVNIYEILMPRVIGIFLNKERIKDENVFFFLDSKINRKDLIKKVLENKAEESKGIFSLSIRKILGLDELKEGTKKDVEKKELNLTLILPNSFFYPDIARYLKENLGINFKIVSSDELNNIIRKKDYDGLLYGINYGYPPNLAYFFSLGGINLNNFENKILEKEFFDLRDNPQKDIFKAQGEIEELILNQKANIFLANPYFFYIIDKKFKGFDLNFIIDPTERFIKIYNLH